MLGESDCWEGSGGFQSAFSRKEDLPLLHIHLCLQDHLCSTFSVLSASLMQFSEWLSNSSNLTRNFTTLPWWPYLLSHPHGGFMHILWTYQKTETCRCISTELLTIFWIYNFNFNPVFSAPGCAVTLKDLTEEGQGTCKSKHLNHCSEFTEPAFFRVILALSHWFGKDLRSAPELTHYTKTRNEIVFSFSAISNKQSEKWGQKPEAEWACCFPGLPNETQRMLYHHFRKLSYLLSCVIAVKALTALIILDKAYLLLHVPLRMCSLKNYYAKS